MIKKYYIALRETPSKYEYNVSSDCIYNLHEIRMLRIEYENMLSCSKKGVFNVQEGHVLECRRAFSRHMLTPLYECRGVG